MTDSDRPGAIRRALISVSDKTGLEPLARALDAAGAELVSTGGTAASLRALGLTVTDVAEITGFPEMMDGRVKTLHPMVHGGLLADRDNASHVEAMTAHGVGAIDLLAVNLYPFEATVASGAGLPECIEKIDVGGPAMIRAAAKNHAHVAVLTDPADYAEAIAEIEAGGTTQGFRRRLAAKAFARTASYDAAIAARLEREGGEVFPDRLSLAGEKRQELRYGENPHQRAAFYATAEARPGVATARLIQGKELSYNNLNDTDAAYELAADLDRLGRPAVAIIKHANPCGAALGDTLEQAYRKALDCDPVSAFGGVIALNRPLDAATAAAIAEIFTEVVIAPSVSAEAAEIFAAKPNLRLLDAGGLPDPGASGLAIKTLAGGFLAQTRDAALVTTDQLSVVTRRAPSPAESEDMLFAWIVAKHVKSNAIVLAKGGATVGVGAGQMSRVDSTRIAAQKAADSAAAAGLTESRAKGCVAASDAFFPFPDGLLAAAEAGAAAIIQPGGSVRDAEVIQAADDKGVAMVFTGERHFRH